MTTFEKLQREYDNQCDCCGSKDVDAWNDAYYDYDPNEYDEIEAVDKYYKAKPTIPANLPKHARVTPSGVLYDYTLYFEDGVVGYVFSQSKTTEEYLKQKAQDFKVYGGINPSKIVKIEEGTITEGLIKDSLGCRWK